MNKNILCLFLPLLPIFIMATATNLFCMEKKIDTQKEYLKKLAHDAALKLKGYDDNAKIYWHPTLIYAERDKNIDITNIIQSFNDFDIVLEKDIDAKDSQKKVESHWQPLKKKDLRKQEIYVICKNHNEKDSSAWHLNHVLDEYLYRKKATLWVDARRIVAAAILAGARPRYINDLFGFFHDGEFLCFLAKKGLDEINFYVYCKTLPMVQLLNNSIDNDDMESWHLGNHCLQSECNWEVLDYLIREHKFFNDNRLQQVTLEWQIRLCELFSKCIKNVGKEEYYLYRKPLLYNHLKKLHLIISFNKNRQETFSQSYISTILENLDLYIKLRKLPKGSIWCNDLMLCKQGVKYHPWYLQEVLELFGNDYGDFPARKIFGQNAFNSTSFDIKLFYK